MENKCGIYGIRSISHPERVYIGSAVNIKRRWYDHLNTLKRSCHCNTKLQNHFIKYGEQDLVFEIIVRCDVTNLIKAEQAFLNLYKPWFNICPTAESPLGRKHSEETRNKISIANKGQIPWSKGKHLTVSHVSKMAASHRGSKRSPAARARMSAARTGTKLSIKTKEKMSLSKLGKGGKMVQDTESGVYYLTIMDAARAKGINYSTLRAYLRGDRPNRSSFKLVK